MLEYFVKERTGGGVLGQWFDFVWCRSFASGQFFTKWIEQRENLFVALSRTPCY